MSGFRLICVSTTLLVALAMSSAVRAENCLQHFSCEMYGACHLPCLDEMTASPAPAPPAPAPMAAPAPVIPRPVVAMDGPSPAVRTSTRAKAPVVRLAYVRVLSRTDVTSLRQLAGQPVSFGLEGDPSQNAGRAAFASLGIKVRETPLDVDNALDGIASGDIAAVVLVSDRDVAKLRGLKTENLHLLAVPAGAQPPSQMRTAFTATMPALGHGGAPVRAFAVDARLLPRLARRQLASNARY